MRRLVELGASIAGICAGALLPGHAQQPDPSFRVSSELVVVDVVAVDRQGRFVTDLTPGEIEVKEDGRRQPVQLLRLVGSPEGTAPVAAAAASTPPASNETLSAPVPVPVPGESPPAVAPVRRLAIVLDGLSLTVDAIPRIRESLLDAIEDLPAGLPAMVATIGPDLELRQPFTTDKARLRQAVSALTPQLDPPAGIARVFDAIDRMCAAAVDQQRVLETAIEAGEQMVADAQARSTASSEALARLADLLGAFAGRKHVVLYSSGHAISPVTQAIDAVVAAVSACTGLDAMKVRRDASSALGRLTTRAASEGLGNAIARANRAQVTFYTLDPAGVTTSTIMPSTRGTARTGGNEALVALPGLRADAGRDYVAGLALETGGLTVTSNDMAVVLRRAWEDATQYYLVGYAPPATEGTRGIRKIAVTVKRSGVSVRFRRGYIAAPTPAATTDTSTTSEAERAIDAALAAPERFASEDIVVTPSVKGDTLSIEVLVPPNAITFRRSEARYEADFAVHAVLREEGARRGTTDVPGKDVALRLTPEEHTRITSAANLRVVLDAPAPKTAARLIVVVRDAAGWMAARELPCCTAAPATRDATAPGDTESLLAKAAAYVDEFVGRFSNVVLEESLTQTAIAAPVPLGGRYSGVMTPGTSTRRQLRSEFLLVRPPSTAFWLAFRDVVEVDGAPVVDRRGRLEQLFLTGARSGLAEAQRIAGEGARFMLGTRTRTTTSPVFALAFLQTHHQPRFRYRVEPPRRDMDARVRVLTSEEVRVPTLLRTDLGDNLPLRGRYEIDMTTGVVYAAEMSLKTLGESLVLRTRYAFDERTQAFIPAEMTEEHVMRSGARVRTVATYGGVRSFDVTTSEAVP